MPFKSKAQGRKFAQLLMKGEISAESFEEWNRETGSKNLPERVKSAPIKKAKVKRKTKKKVRRTAKRKSLEDAVCFLRSSARRPAGGTSLSIV
jgi:hypothetical protein